MSIRKAFLFFCFVLGFQPVSCLCQFESRNTFGSFRNKSKSYDLSEQEVVYKALLSACAQAPYRVDELIHHVDNSNYCYTYLGSSRSEDVSVGSACEAILTACVTLKSNREEFRIPSHADAMYLPLRELRTSTSKQETWKRIFEKGIYALQVESVERQIVSLKSANYDSNKSSSSRLPQMSEHDFELRRQESLQELQTTKLVLDRTKRPISPDGAVLFGRLARTGNTVADK